MKRLLAIVISSITGIAALATPAMATQTQVQIVLNLSGNAERHLTKYECEGEETLRQVEYINAAPNFLAILTVEDQQVIFTSVISASGARYAAGSHVWWTKGAEASLFDETRGEDPIITCLEASETP